jgi:hypothetical protein
MASFLDVCRFTAVSTGTVDFVVSSAVTGYQTPASAGAVSGAVYRYRAESADLSQWEVGYGAYTSGSTTLARTTVLFNSSGTTSKISFSAAPQVAVVALAEDLLCTLLPQGRITLTSGSPVMASTVTAATTIYYAPFVGIYVPVNVAGTFSPYPITSSDTDAVGLSIVLGANWATNSIYDVFVALDGSTLRLATGPDWSAGAVAGSNTIGSSSRGTGAGSTELQIFRGLLTNKNSMTLRYANASTFTAAANEATYLGTVRTGSAGQVSFTYGSVAAGGGTANLFVWNAYNQVPITTVVTDGTSSWTYSTATIRASNNSSSNRINFLQGLAQGGIDASLNQLVRIPAVVSAFARIGVALNSTTTLDRTGQSTNNTTTGVADNPAAVRMAYAPQLGANYISSNEIGDGTNTATFFGQSSGSTTFHMLVVTLAM